MDKFIQIVVQGNMMLGLTQNGKLYQGLNGMSGVEEWREVKLPLQLAQAEKETE